MRWFAWKKSSPLIIGRKRHTATLLDDGRVLVTGGYAYGALPDTEIWSPATTTWAPSDRMTAGRWRHGAIRLVDGRVLVVGGEWRRGQRATSEIWNPDVERWGMPAGVTTTRLDLTLTLLHSGAVLAVGGVDGAASRPTALVEEWDPPTNTWKPCPSLATGRFGHSATILRDGRVLVVGGACSAPHGSGTVSAGFHIAHLLHGPEHSHLQLLRSAEIWDPRTGRWTMTGPLGIARAFHGATALPDGRVVVAGGAEQAPRSRVASTEIWDPGQGVWTHGPALPGPRYAHSATGLEDGRVLVAGGEREDEGTICWEDSHIWNPLTGDCNGAGTLRRARSSHTATLLGDGRVLLAGGTGRSQSDPLCVTEVWQPR